MPRLMRAAEARAQRRAVRAREVSVRRQPGACAGANRVRRRRRQRLSGWGKRTDGCYARRSVTCSRLGGERGGAQGVRAHMRDACGLSGCSGGGQRGGRAHLTSGGMPRRNAGGFSTSSSPRANAVSARPHHRGDYSRSFRLEYPSTRSAQSAATPRRSAGQLRSASAEAAHRATPRFRRSAPTPRSVYRTPSSASRSSPSRFQKTGCTASQDEGT